jgi:hypothetical protein
MAASPASNPAEITGNVLFYKQPEPLSLEKHRLLGCKRVDRPFKFLAETHVVPITVNEFPVACASYPIIFAGAAKTPLAVMGARAGENVFVSAEGDVDPEMYLAAFVRRYPFVFAAEPSGERMVVCIDRAAPMISEGPEIPLFNGDQPSQFTQEAIEFCKDFERLRAITANFAAKITELDLWEAKAVSVGQTDAAGQPTGEPIKVADYFAVSEEKLNALPQDKFLQLRSEGWLAAIYAHMLSLLLWPKVLNRTVLAASAQQAQQPAPARKN